MLPYKQYLQSSYSDCKTQFHQIQPLSLFYYKTHSHYKTQYHLLMGKKKHFDKHRSIVFKLIPAVDKNNQSKIMFQPVVPKRCTLSKEQKQSIIKQFSNQHEFPTEKLQQHDDRFDGIPPEILQKIRGRNDLIINGKAGKGPQVVMEDDDFMVEEVSDEQMMMEDIEEQQYNEEEKEEEGEEWQTDSDEDQNQVQDQKEEKQLQPEQIVQKKPKFNSFQEQFPELPEPGTSASINQKQNDVSSLTKQQIKLLNGILPENYQSMKIQNAKMKMFDEDGNPIDGYDYSQHYSRGGGHVIAKFQVQFVAPASADIDIKQQQMPNQGKEVDQALEKADIYQQLEDDFFINLVKMDNVKIQHDPATKKNSKNQIKAQQKTIQKQKLQKFKVAQQNMEMQQFTEQQLYQAMNEMRNKPLSQVKNKEQNQDHAEKKARNVQEGDDDDDYQDVEDENQQMDQDIEDEMQQEQDDERQFHELSRKEKRIFMKNYKIPQVQDLAKQELKIKMKTFKGAKSEEIHLRTIHERIPFAQDAAMKDTLQRGSDTSSIHTQSEPSSDDDDIVSYHTKHSTVSSSVNFIMQQTKKKEKRQIATPKPLTCQDIKKPEQPVSQKRNKDQTKQQKKLRKQELKDFKKEKRESKKQYIQQLKAQKKIVTGNSKSSMYGISHMNIL